MQCYFSMILPVYNVEKYLKRCLTSILNQNFTEYEIILVDDGSTDLSGKICDEYSNQYPFIQTIHKENGGLSSARNEGLKRASGKYIFMIDSDDWIEDNALEKLYDYTKNQDIDIVKFDYIRQPENKKKTSILEEGLRRNEELKTIIPLVLKETGKVNFSAWGHIYRNSFLKQNDLRFVSERIIGSEDYLFNLQAYCQAKSLLVIPEFLYNYDMREGSLTKRYRKNIFMQYNILHDKFKECLIGCEMFDTTLKRALAYSYIEKLIGVCMQNECIMSDKHNWKDGVKNCKEMVRNNSFREYISYYPFSEVGIKRKILIKSLSLHIVLPCMILLKRGIK